MLSEGLMRGLKSVKIGKSNACTAREQHARAQLLHTVLLIFSLCAVAPIGRTWRENLKLDALGEMSVIKKVKKDVETLLFGFSERYL